MLSPDAIGDVQVPSIVASSLNCDGTQGSSSLALLIWCCLSNKNYVSEVVASLSSVA